jgi:uncharacterized membrane protein YdbT with pleckstrin-like domain
MINVFEKSNPTIKVPEPRPVISISETLIKVRPTCWVVVYSYFLAIGFSFLAYRFFLWCPPYLQEVVKNLRGLPFSWFEVGIYWLERIFIGIALLSAIYHNLWKMCTLYKLTDHDIQIGNWFPMRRHQSIPYGAVKRIGFEQSLLGIVLDYGNVEIDTGSFQGSVILANCPKPQKFVETLQHKIEEILQPHVIQSQA